jgi:hypothetical protein
MGLADIVRAGVATANKITGGSAGLQVPVTHEAWIGQDGYAAKLYAAPVTRTALVEEGARPRRTSTGEVLLTRAHITFLAPIEANGAAGRLEPIDPRDRFTLPSGVTGPIVDFDGMPVDVSTGRSFLSGIWLGTTEGSQA